MNASKKDHNKYCLPVIAKKRAEVQKIVTANSNRFRFIEIWLDYIDDLDVGFAPSLIGTHPNKLIFVFRRQKLEPMKMSPELRWMILTALSRKQCLVDFDITVQTDEITKVQAERIGLKLLLSYHNYSLTPSDTELRSTVARMQGWNAQIIKISTHCNTQRDALRLLSLLIELREMGQKAIIVGMGKHGVITRVFGTMWGNELAFTPLESANASAAGQLTVDRMDSIMEALGS